MLLGISLDTVLMKMNSVSKNVVTVLVGIPSIRQFQLVQNIFCVPKSYQEKCEVQLIFILKAFSKA